MCVYNEYENGHERCGQTLTRGVVDQVIIIDLIIINLSDVNIIRISIL